MNPPAGADTERRPLSVERMLEEELDPAQSDRAPASRPLLDILDAEKILSDFLLSDEVRRLR